MDVSILEKIIRNTIVEKFIYEKELIDIITVWCMRTTKDAYFINEAPKEDRLGIICSKSSFSKNMSCTGLLKKAAKTAAAAFCPGVLQKMSIINPRRKEISIKMLRLMASGILIIKYTYKKGVA